MNTNTVPRKLPNKILLLTLLPILVGIGTSVALVDREVHQLTASETQIQLQSARDLAIEFLEARSEALLAEAWVVARDPKFFALLATPGVQDDEFFRTTFDDITAQFGHVVASDWIEVVDPRGKILATWRPIEQRNSAEHPLSSYVRDLRVALSGQPASDFREDGEGNVVQVATVPVFAANRQVGALRHGRIVDPSFLIRIRDLTRCEVAILVDGKIHTATTNEIEHGRNVTARLTNLDPVKPFTVGLYRSTEASEAFMSHLRQSLVIIGLLALVAGLVLARQIVRHLSDPVDQLVDAAARLEQGKEDLPIAIHTGDELEYLGRRFDEMRTALHRQIRSLKELDHMKSTFLTIASHELRTPITVISGNLDLLEVAESPDDPMYQEGVDGVRRGLDRVRDVLTRISEMSMIDSKAIELSMRDVSSTEILGDLRREWDRLSKGRKLEWVVVPPEETLWVRADGERLRQAATNLIHNAIRFTPDGGTVRLTVESSDIGESHKSGKSPTVRICVEDTGIGVAPDDTDRIFEAFYESADVMQHSSGDQTFGSSGLGLGLAISRSILEAHGGAVQYEPRPEGGSRFTLELPGRRVAASRQEHSDDAAPFGRAA